MKIDKINTYSYHNGLYLNKKSNNTQIVNFSSNQKQDEFVNNKTFKDKIVAAFFKKELSPIEKKSKQISDFNYEATKLSKQAKKEAKKNSKDFTKIYNSAAKNKFKPMTNYCSKETNYEPKNIYFSDFDESNIARITNIWQEGKLHKSFQIDTIVPCTFYRIIDNSDTSKTKRFYMMNRTLLSYFEQDKKTGVSKLIVPADNGLYFAKGENSTDYTIDNPEEYIAQGKYYEVIDGVENSYSYDKKSKLWLKDSLN